MLLHASDYALAPWIDSILPTLAPHLADHVDAETHGSAIELRTGVHDSVSAAIAELADAARRAAQRARGQRAACGRRRHAPHDGMAGDAHLRRRALPAAVRVSARARAPRADVRSARPRRRPRPRGRAARDERPARASAAAAGAVGELPLLAGTRDRTRVDAHADVRRVPACRAPARLRRLRRLRREHRPAACAAAPFRSRRSCGGTCACSRAGERSRCASWTPR